MEIQKTVAANLIRARGDISRAELAKKAGVTYQHIYELEETDKNPSLKVLEKIADALEIEVYFLLKRDGEPAKPKATPVSKTLQKMMNVPDEVYDLASRIGIDDEVWKEKVIPLLQYAESKKQSASLNKA